MASRCHKSPGKCHLFKNLVYFSALDRMRTSMISHEPALTAPDEVLRGLYPLILTLDTHGVPHRWITWQHACYYYAKNQVAWALGEQAFTVYGGLNRTTGRRAEITASRIL